MIFVEILISIKKRLGLRINELELKTIKLIKISKKIICHETPNPIKSRHQKNSIRT